MDHFLRPRNVGRIDGGFEGNAINLDCNDTVIFTVSVGDGVVGEAKFMSKGCAGAIACCSAATEMITGSTIDEAAALDAGAIADYLGGLPAAKMGCAEMAASGIREALAASSG